MYLKQFSFVKELCSIGAKTTYRNPGSPTYLKMHDAQLLNFLVNRDEKKPILIFGSTGNGLT